MKKNWNKLIALLAVLCMLTSLFSFAVADEVPECPDSPTGEHIFDLVKDGTTRDATCQEYGTWHKVCQYCGASPEKEPYTLEEMVDHNMLLVETKEFDDPEASCEEPGVHTITWSYKCEWCDETSKESISFEVEALGHDWSVEPVEIPGTRIGAKCVEPSTFEQAIICERCGAEMEGTRETVTEDDAPGHDPADEVEENRVESTCAVNGHVDKVVYCNRCHIELSRRTVVLPLAEHVAADPVPELLQAATCMDYAKYDLVTYCSVCGLELNRDRNQSDETLVGSAQGTYYYPLGTTEREGLMDHQFDDLDEDNKNYVAPTCYSEGTGVYWCSICGLKNELREIPRLEHNYGPEYIVPATCMDKGARMQECQNDGCYDAYVADPVDNATHYLILEELPIDEENGHKWVLSPINEDANPGTDGVEKPEGSATRLPTCTKVGINAYVCEYNNAHRYAEKVPALGHELMTLPSIPATCTKGGWTAGLICTRVDENGDSICDGTSAGELPQDYIDALPDDFELPEKYLVLTLPEATDANGHTKLVITKPDTATCNEGGVISYICSVCGELIEDEPTEALGHDWFRVEEDDEPADCFWGGYASFRCSRCGEEMVQFIPATGEHDFGEYITEEATCRQAGRIYRVCNVCGYEEIQEYLPIDENAHQWEIDWGDVKKNPTCTEPGIGAQVCTICETRKYGRLDPTDHSPVEIPGVEPTCEDFGWTSETFCEWCGETLEEKQPIAPLGHDWEVVDSEDATCVKEGKVSYVCTRCGEEKVEEGELDPTVHSPVAIEGVEPTCTEAGLTAGSVCEWCETVLEEQEEIPALGHDWEEIDVEESTCVKAGKTTYACTRCGEEKVEEGELGEHTLIRWKALDKAPTCVTPAADAYVCFYCDYVEYRDAGKADPTEHVWVKIERVSVPTCVHGAIDLYGCYYCDARKLVEDEDEKADPANHVFCDIGDEVLHCYYCDATKAK